MSRSPFLRGERLIVEESSELDRSFSNLADIDQVIYIIFSNLGFELKDELTSYTTNLQISPVDSDGSLRGNLWLSDELDIQRPHTVMLCDGKSPESPVKSVSRSCDLALRDQEGEVVQPDTRILVHLSQSPFKGVVEGLKRNVINTKVLKLCSSLNEIVVPQLVRPREALYRSFVNQVSGGSTCTLLELQVSKPTLDRFSVIGYVFLRFVSTLYT